MDEAGREELERRVAERLRDAYKAGMEAWLDKIAGADEMDGWRAVAREALAMADKVYDEAINWAKTESRVCGCAERIVDRLEKQRRDIFLITALRRHTGGTAGEPAATEGGAARSDSAQPGTGQAYETQGPAGAPDSDCPSHCRYCGRLVPAQAWEDGHYCGALATTVYRSGRVQEMEIIRAAELDAARDDVTVAGSQPPSGTSGGEPPRKGGSLEEPGEPAATEGGAGTSPPAAGHGERRPAEVESCSPAGAPDLLPCPFCGGSASILQLRRQNAVVIQCDSCGAGSPRAFHHKDDATEHAAWCWNRRDGRSMNATRFWSKVNKTTDCWNWTGSRSTDGYGRFVVNGRNENAHRVAWLLAGRKIPSGAWVLHRCDNPSCVRVDHLFLVLARAKEGT